MVDPDFFSSDEKKDTLAYEVLPSVIKKFDLVALGMVISTWQAVIDKEEREAGHWVRPSQHPNRREMLLIAAVDAYSDEIYMAEIVRHENAPPTLEKWERTGAGADNVIGGRMIDPLRTALRPQG
jgi:hypothetical protein